MFDLVGWIPLVQRCSAFGRTISGPFQAGTGGIIGDGGVAGETLVAIGPSELMRALKRAEGARTGEVIGEPDDELVTSVVTRFYRSAKLMDFTLSWVFPAI